MARISLNVNGKVHAIDADPDMPLLYALKEDIGLNNPQFGCGLAQCGACTVHVDGEPIRSCVTPISSVGAGKVVTLSGLGTPEKPHPLQTAYVEEQVTQCGYCINGWIMTAAAFLEKKKKPTEAEIRQALEGTQVPLRHPHEHPARGQARGGDDGLREATMTRMASASRFSRRSLLKAGGALVVSVGMPIGLGTVLAVNRAFAQGTRPPLVPDQLSSYIAVNADGSVSAFFGKMDMGQGLYVSIGQIVAEELDVPFDRVNVLMADTRTSVNQGGASGSTGIQRGGVQMRAAAAEARRVLVEMAAEKLGVPAGELTVTDGVVHAKGDAGRKASLRRADRRALLQRPAGVEQADRQQPLRPRPGQAEGSQGAQDRRPADQARRRRAQGVLPGAVRHRRQDCRHGACPHDPSAGGGRHRRQRRRNPRSRTLLAPASCARTISSP